MGSIDLGEGVPKHAGRREFLRGVGYGALALGTGASLSSSLGCAPSQAPAMPPEGARDAGNFRAVYDDEDLRSQFQQFLANVFHLYPEDELDALIAQSVATETTDPGTYHRVATSLPEVSPVLGALRYGLPALRKQKRVMAEQTTALLGQRRRFEGYLELGSHGRYLSALQDHIEVEGPVFTCAQRPPTHSLEDLIDRGQWSFLGEPVPWTDYAPFETLPKGALSLVSVYIGLHHARVDQRADFIGSIRDAMREGGVLILRDHDVTSEGLSHLVGLAHDVFNVGTGETWDYNEDELRNFYPLETIVSLLEQEGFRAEPGRKLQPGDPTRNTLCTFRKV